MGGVHDDRFGSEAVGADGPPSRRGGLVWVGVGLAALVVLEWTANPALAVALGCLKFGWDALATARWLKRTDPDRVRGRVCARFYAAWALWKVSMVGMVMMFLVAIIDAHIEAMRPNGPLVTPPPVFMGAALTAMIGFLISAWMSNRAVVSAWRRGFRVWLGAEAGRARKHGVWPPSLATTGVVRENRASAIVLTALVTDLTVFGIVVLIVAMNLNQPPRLAGPIPPWVAMIALAATFGIPPVVILASLDSIKRRIVAPTPFDCWPLDEAGPNRG